MTSRFIVMYDFGNQIPKVHHDESSEHIVQNPGSPLGILICLTPEYVCPAESLEL